MNRPRTEAQIAASRANGALSHGPVAEEGQRIAQSNNLKHGLLSKTILIENESAEIFENLLLSHIHEFDPRGAAEMFCVEAMGACTWRQIRVWGMTTGGHNLEIVRQPETSPEVARHPMPARAYIAVSDMNQRDNGMSTLLRYEGEFEPRHGRQLRKLITLKQLREFGVPKP